MSRARFETSSTDFLNSFSPKFFSNPSLSIFSSSFSSPPNLVIYAQSISPLHIYIYKSLSIFLYIDSSKEAADLGQKTKKKFKFHQTKNSKRDKMASLSSIFNYLSITVHIIIFRTRAMVVYVSSLGMGCMEKITHYWI